jgi:hypothetical protein
VHSAQQEDLKSLIGSRNPEDRGGSFRPRWSTLYPGQLELPCLVDNSARQPQKGTVQPCGVTLPSRTGTTCEHLPFVVPSSPLSSSPLH